MGDDRGGDRDWESLKLCFEFFKHFTTLATAAGLVFIALFREFDLHPWSVVFGLSMMAVALLLSLVGLLSSLSRATGGPFEIRPGYATFVLSAFVLASFFGGVVAFITLADGP